MLSDEKISELWYANAPQGNFAFKLARAIEAAVLAEQAKAGTVAMVESLGCGAKQAKMLRDLPIGTTLYLHPAPAPEGMVMVPRKATEAMLAVIRNEHGAYETGEALYADLIAAAEKEAGK